MIDDITPKWFAINTRFKSEKIVERILKQKGVKCYLPLQKRSRKHGQKVLITELPLISCYVFVNITKEHYVKVLETEYVVGFVRFAKDIIPIPEEEFTLMQRVVGEISDDIQVEKITFYEGDMVEVSEGNLAGIRGKLLEIEGKNRMLIELNQLGFSLQISIDKNNLIKVI